MLQRYQRSEEELRRVAEEWLECQKRIDAYVDEQVRAWKMGRAQVPNTWQCLGCGGCSWAGLSHVGCPTVAHTGSPPGSIHAGSTVAPRSLGLLNTAHSELAAGVLRDPDVLAVGR